ncbi:acyltransferase family protein [Nocardioides aurantiacus]|uniref:Acyltransferase-like protein n=1 Tax=Nocardioides aurantiacus TaxID=86796 RepID=A0A3N2CTK1_9ACTN|nr:acyltransferase [Nocardioides aurantiacus]ROR90841.1 acyltransferase-like protein [Nocardioides aurantiacus]
MPSRNRTVDLVRVGSILVVVAGHWLMQGLWVDETHHLHRRGLLELATWTHPLTWLLQVMPLVFLVGGFANGTSWSSARSRGVPYGAWLAHRAARLTRPMVQLILAWAGVVALAPVLSLPADWVRVAARAALVPTWFLAVYLVVVALTPLCLAAWDRWRWRSVLGLAAGAAVLDLVGVVTGHTWWSAPNVALVWLGCHQLGLAWREGRVPRPRVLALALAGCAGLLLVLVTWGPYAVSMVGLRGFGTDNTVPPHVTLLLLGTAQACLVLLADPWLDRACSHPLVWVCVVAVETRAMTVYLWHMTALGLVAGASVASGGLGLGPRPDSAAWWWSRPAWILALAATTAVLVAATGRWETPLPPATTRRVAPALPWAAIVVASACLGLLAREVPTERPWLAAALLLGPVLAHQALHGAAGRDPRGRSHHRDGSGVLDPRDSGPSPRTPPRSTLAP